MPEGKGKLERFHRTFREQFLSELDLSRVANIDELNARLWAWIELIYHTRPHAGLDKLDTNEHQSPIERWRQDLTHVRPLTTPLAERLDDIFCHYIVRTVRKDGTVSWEGNFFEVRHNLVGEKVTLVINPHTQAVLRVETAFGDNLGQAHPIDRVKNTQRTRQKSHYEEENTTQSNQSMVELVHQDYVNRCALPVKEEEN